MTNTLDYYLSLHYPIELWPDPEGGFVATHPDLEGCLAQGETPDEVVNALAEARQLWLRTRLDDGLPIPEPRDEEEYSGRFVLRVSRNLHARLARRAAKDSVSLNQYIGLVLAEHLGGTTSQAQWQVLSTPLVTALEAMKPQHAFAPLVQFWRDEPALTSSLWWQVCQAMPAGSEATRARVNEPPSEHRWTDAELPPVLRNRLGLNAFEKKVEQR